MSLGLYSFCHNTCSATVTRFLLAKMLSGRVGHEISFAVA
ncbi:hypothetical protein HMPREF9997_02291 [Corynebacterium durum F0235]|uniref:Uncharacterized protein n=1 Tax=Corynebacterium durum F0235 TaxID=1035195 RepID=L1MBL5_9CORY|nr:hypothetical protein HMPREF9997_02291 [Corynebacterium durum F0235]